MPRVLGRDDCTFLGVFDGTVGDVAADFVHNHLADAVCQNEVRQLAARLVRVQLT